MTAQIKETVLNDSTDSRGRWKWRKGFRVKGLYNAAIWVIRVFQLIERKHLKARRKHEQAV
jgi:hypothetical protein